MAKIVLASASPRRQELLGRMGAQEVEFAQLEDFDALPRPVAGLF